MKNTLLTAAFVSLVAQSASAVVVGVLTRESKSNFDTKIKPIFDQEVAGCKSCELKNLTPYNDKGEYDSSRLIQTIQNIGDDVNVVFIDWNEKYSDKNKNISEALSKLVNNGRVVIASAGVPQENEATCPLRRTLMGQVNESLIVGELTERERLLPQCYYGPEMLSAFKPPKSLLGQGYAPLIFVGRLAENWNKRKSKDWVGFLQGRKQKSKRLWPEMEEFFPR